MDDATETKVIRQLIANRDELTQACKDGHGVRMRRQDNCPTCHEILATEALLRELGFADAQIVEAAGRSRRGTKRFIPSDDFASGPEEEGGVSGWTVAATLYGVLMTIVSIVLLVR